MIYPIVLFGDPVLKKKAASVEKEDINLKEFIDDMFETMYHANGVGLAAPQIGKSIRIFTIDTTPMEDDESKGVKQVFINPEIINEQGRGWAFEEGCLSIPGIREDVHRLPKIKIRFQDENWVEHEKSFDGMIARVIQHEYDHIEGILFTDHITNLKKRLLKGRLTNISKGKVDVDYRVKAPAKK
ncbi:MAG: peptide deformylase [Cyclobacteriaceae bacterium]|jgi:peptide deformylase